MRKGRSAKSRTVTNFKRFSVSSYRRTALWNNAYYRNLTRPPVVIPTRRLRTIRPIPFNRRVPPNTLNRRIRKEQALAMRIGSRRGLDSFHCRRRRDFKKWMMKSLAAQAKKAAGISGLQKFRNRLFSMHNYSKSGGC
jgi:hypothetical protein